MGGIASCISNLMYLSEKFTLCLACTGLICCLVLTITVTLGMGVGLGYNYCFVDMKTKYKYIRGHYIYPGSPRWPYHTRQGNVAEEPALDEMAEDDELRRLPQEPYKGTSYPDDTDLTVLRQYLRNNNTGDGTTMDYHPTFPDSESFNGTESSEIDAPTKDAVTEMTENSPETNSSSNATASTTEVETEIIDETDKPTSVPSTEIIDKTDEPTPVPSTEIIDKTDEPTPVLTIVNKEQQPKSSPSTKRVKKLVIPISGLDLISLLTKLKAENRNYSLQIVTT